MLALGLTISRAALLRYHQIVPFLPFLFDKPVEHVVDWTFEKIESGLAKGVNGGEPRREL